MRTNYRLKFPEEIELESKEAELARLKLAHKASRENLVKLKSELRAFERVYHLVIGVRIAELDALEAQICGTADECCNMSDEIHTSADAEWSGHLHASDLLNDDRDPAENTAQKSLKALYREVAKTIHPDLAQDDRDRARREKLMSFANRAYADENKEALLNILKEWEHSAEKISGGNIGAALIRVIRFISKERECILELEEQIDKLKSTDSYIFKQRVDDSLANGIDLLAEMAATIDLNIANARKRLSAMRGEPLPIDPVLSQINNRLIRFPADLSCGVLYTRKRDSINYCDWQKICNAKGVRAIPVNMAVRLDVRGDLTPDLRFLKELRPDDLQSLFMYEVTDTALGYITHLSGLEEIYLSDSTFSDNGIAKLSSLINLSRIYLYHINITDSGLVSLYGLKKLSQFTCSGTMVTESGLQALQKAVPGVKTLSFPWRYGKK
ncbi:hypothetical protein OR1_00750 [Geobacter sp. OR-1]|uniref:hypothetical protein n=1 Tax=Geobacter sp. OR-1 TaxID=1266765 RepID=UPI0005430806|nr:hypothetical protein [Geobacter sp. OR-1]GAM08478.1 hypothetical protein OR1_00750 [Geobacter sp. OR-1]